MFPLALSAQVSPLQVEVNVGTGVSVQEVGGEDGFEGEAGDGAAFGPVRQARKLKSLFLQTAGCGT